MMDSSKPVRFLKPPLDHQPMADGYLIWMDSQELRTTMEISCNHTQELYQRDSLEMPLKKMLFQSINSLKILSPTMLLKELLAVKTQSQMVNSISQRPKPIPSL